MFLGKNFAKQKHIFKFRTLYYKSNMKQFAAIIQAISLLLMKKNKKMFEYTVLRNR